MAADEGAESLLAPLLADASSLHLAAQAQPRPHHAYSGGKNRALWGFAVLCSSFFLLFGALCPLQNVLTSALAHDGLGATSIGLSFVTMFFGSFAAPAIIARLGAPRTLLLSSLATPAYCAANLAPSWASLIPASVALGLGDSALWVACGEVVTLLAAEHAAAWGADKDRMIGLFNSIFWTTFQVANLSGNGVMSLLLTRGERPGAANAELTPLLVGFTCCSAAGAALLSLLPGCSEGPGHVHTPPLVPRRETDADASNTGVGGGGRLSTGSAGAASVATRFAAVTEVEAASAPVPEELPPAAGGVQDGGRWLRECQSDAERWLGGDQGPPSTSGRTLMPPQDAAAAAAALTAVSLPALLVPLLPLFLYSGAEGAFAWSVFTKQVITPTLGMDQIGSVFLVNGAVNGLASLLLSGRGVRSVCLILGAGAASHTAVFRWLSHENDGGSVHGLSRQSLFLAAGALGFGDAVCNTQIGTLLGILVPPESLKVAFAVWKGLFSLACGCVFIAEPYVDGRLGISLAVIQAVLLTAACGLALTATRTLRREQQRGGG